MKYITIIFIFCLYRLDCKTENGNTYVNNCDSILKFENLLQQIVNKKDIYMITPGDTSRFDYIISNFYTRTGKIFYAFDNIPVIPIFTDKIDTLQAGIIFLKEIDFHDNVSEVNIKVLYYSNGINNTESTFKFKFDSVNCSWQTLDSMIKVF